MAASKPKPTKEKKPIAPSHVKHLRAMMDLARDPSNMSHPLVVPPAGTPADGNVTQQVGGDDQMIPAKTGEYVIPEPVVRAKGTQFFDNLIKKVLQDSLPPDQAEEATEKAGSGTPETGYKWGGEISAKQEQGSGYPLPVSNPSYPATAVRSYQEGLNLHINPTNPDTGAPWDGNEPFGHTPNSNVETPRDHDFNPDPYGLKDQFDPKAANFLTQTYPSNPYFGGSNPWFNVGGYQPPTYTPGFSQGQTLPTNPSFFDNAGYPWAQPVTGSSDEQSAGQHPHTPPKSDS